MNNNLNSINTLENYWKRALASSEKLSPISEEVFLDLTKAYGQPGRFYHNLDHIQQVLVAIEEMSFLTQNTQTLFLAAWFHDFVYDPKSSDNEEKSAAQADIYLKQLHLPNCSIKRVVELILITKKHLPKSNDIDQYILLDADLAILGTKPNIYQNYAQGIRQEYAWVPEEEYRYKRQKVLLSFLDRKRLYFTNHCWHKLEASARKNIESEIAHLAT